MPFLILLLYTLERMQSNACIYMWLFVALLQILVMNIIPMVIEPLSSRFSPLENGVLYQKLVSVAKKLKFPLKTIMVCDGTDRNDHSKIFMCGIFTKSIVLYNTLSKEHSDDEIIALFIHEIGHWKGNHLIKNTIRIQMHLLIVAVLISSMLKNTRLFEAFGFLTPKEQPAIVILYLFSILNEPFDLIILFFSNIMAHQHEYYSDKYACSNGCSESLMQALIKMQVARKFSNANPDYL